jgi:hypothetical protein
VIPLMTSQKVESRVRDVCSGSEAVVGDWPLTAICSPWRMAASRQLTAAEKTQLLAQRGESEELLT